MMQWHVHCIVHFINKTVKKKRVFFHIDDPEWNWGTAVQFTMTISNSTAFLRSLS